MSKASDRPDYDFGPFEDDYRGFQDDSEGARGPLILALAGGILLIFGAVLWNTYKQGIREGAGTLPVVYADASPYKRSPVEPGGVITPDQDRRIYDVVDGSTRPDPEGPLSVTPPPDADPVLQGGPPIDLRPGEETDLDEVSGIPRAALPRLAALDNLDNLPGDTDADPAETDVVADPFSVSGFKFDPSGNYLVQIAALRTQEAADKAWTGAVKANPQIYEGAEKNVQRADLGAKGVFYRLRAGSFGAREEAVSFCDALKEKGGTCIVVTG